MIFQSAGTCTGAASALHRPGAGRASRSHSTAGTAPIPADRISGGGRLPVVAGADRGARASDRAPRVADSAAPAR